MALGTYRADDINRAKTYIGPHGNLSHKTGRKVVPAAIAQNDTIDLMVLPRGAQIIDCILNVIGTPGANVTYQLGLAQIPGKSDVKVDADGLIAATAAATTVLLRRNKTGIEQSALLLDDDYLVQALAGGGNPDAEHTLEATVIYEFTGTP